MAVEFTAYEISLDCTAALQVVSVKVKSVLPSFALFDSNNIVDKAVIWLVFSMKLNMKDGFREKRGLYLFPCWNQNFYFGNLMLMKTLSLAGDWCWYPLSTVPRISHNFTLFVLLLLYFLLWLCRKTTSSGASYTLPGIFFPLLSPSPSLAPCLSPSFLTSTADSHLSTSTSNTWSGANF